MLSQRKVSTKCGNCKRRSAAGWVRLSASSARLKRGKAERDWTEDRRPRFSARMGSKRCSSSPPQLALADLLLAQGLTIVAPFPSFTETPQMDR